MEYHRIFIFIPNLGSLRRLGFSDAILSATPSTRQRQTMGMGFGALTLMTPVLLFSMTGASLMVQ